MVGEDETVKVLDFGLAKLLAAEDASRPETVTDLRSLALTVPGKVGGTTAYMSPEQVTGGMVDARSDVFSFGATLYEMATDTRAFARASRAETLDAVLHAEPMPPTQLVPSLPRDLERVILRCLRKEPERRYCRRCSM